MCKTSTNQRPGFQLQLTYDSKHCTGSGPQNASYRELVTILEFLIIWFERPAQHQHPIHIDTDFDIEI